MNHLNLKTAATALILAFGLPAVSACSDAPPPGEVNRTGTLTAALLTAGSDGATYQFPAGTMMRLATGSFDSSYPLDGGENVLTIQVPAGLVSVQLTFPSGTPSSAGRRAGSPLSSTPCGPTPSRCRSRSEPVCPWTWSFISALEASAT
jgi:hypothetical protein